MSFFSTSLDFSVYTKYYTLSFSLIKSGFKEEEKRALDDYKSNDKEYVKRLAFLSYESKVYQVRMYGVFLFGYLSVDTRNRGWILELYLGFTVLRLDSV